MGRNRDRLTCFAVGTTKELTWSLPPVGHHVQRSYQLLAEVSRGGRHPESWLAQAPGSDMLIEIVPKMGGSYAQRAVPQEKAHAALTAAQFVKPVS